ncbi:MAG: hypothetical protein WBW41_14275 [Verrucomicrobiia bacterium]
MASPGGTPNRKKSFVFMASAIHYLWRSRSIQRAKSEKADGRAY